MRALCLLVMLFVGAPVYADYTLVNPYVIDSIPRGSVIEIRVGNRLPSSMKDSEARELINSIGARIRAKVDVTLTAGGMSPASLCDNETDGISTICFGDIPTIAAKCVVELSMAGGCGQIFTDPYTREFVEMDIWAGDWVRKDYLPSFWMHEILHGLGIHHSTNPEAIMYKYGNARFDFHADDENALKCLFPEDLADYALAVGDDGYLHIPHLTAMHLPGLPVYSVGAQLEMLNGRPYRFRVVNAELYRPNGDKDIACKDVWWHGNNTAIRLPRVLFQGQVYALNLYVKTENGSYYMDILNHSLKQR